MYRVTCCARVRRSLPYSNTAGSGCVSISVRMYYTQITHLPITRVLKTCVTNLTFRLLAGSAGGRRSRGARSPGTSENWLPFPGRAFECGVKQAANRYRRSVRRSDDEKLHVIERNVEADRKPQRPAAQHRIRHQQTQTYERDDVPNILTRFVEVVIRRKNQRDDDRTGP